MQVADSSPTDGALVPAPTAWPAAPRRARLGILGWGLATFAGAALPGLIGVGIGLGLTLRFLLENDLSPLVIWIGAPIIGVAFWARAVNAWRVAVNGIGTGDMAQIRRSHSAGGLQADEPTRWIHRVASSDRVWVSADEVLPDLTRVAHAVADEVGVPRPERVMLDQQAEELIGTREALFVGMPLLAVATLDEIRSEMARVMVTNAAAPLSELSRARVLCVMAEALDDVEVRALRRSFSLATFAGARVAAAARTVAQHTDEVARDAATGVASRKVAHTVWSRRTAVDALWRVHLAEQQRQWTAASTPVAPLSSWPEAYEVHVGKTVRRVDHAASTVLEFDRWLPGAGATARVPQLPAVTALAELAGDRLAAVLRRWEDESAGGYFVSPHVEQWAEVSPEQDHPLPSLATMVEQASATQEPAWELLERQVAALTLAMERRDAQSLALARELDSPQSWPGVRLAAAATRWLAGDAAALESLGDALEASPGAVAAVDLLEPHLRSAGAVQVADQIASARTAVDSVLASGVNLAQMWGRGDVLSPVAASSAVQQLIADYATDMASWKAAWLVTIDVQVDGAPPRWGLIVRRSSLTVNSPLPDPGMLRVALPLLHVADYRDLEGRRRKVVRKAAPVWRQQSQAWWHRRRSRV